MEVEAEPVIIIRETTRDLLKSNRRFHRGEESDIRRSVKNQGSTSTEGITEITEKLKTKSSMTVSELLALKNGLMDDLNNITVVLNTHGAVRGLVRELTGNDVRKQCAAAGCLCNLALGDAKAGLTLTKAAGSYLIAALDGLAPELTVPCTWAIGNMAASGPHAVETLVAQGVVPRLAELLASNVEDIREGAVYAVLHVVTQLQDELRKEHLEQILQSLATTEVDMMSSRLLFTLSCHKDFCPFLIPQFHNFLPKLSNTLVVSLDNYLSDSNEDNRNELLFLIRTLANIEMTVNVCYRLLNHFLQNNLSDKFKILFSKDSDVKESLFWLLGNLFSCCSDHLFFKKFANC